jgi:acetylornithine deacetylase/succinyl-diaminopimelate desuccinylase-like protein
MTDPSERASGAVASDLASEASELAREARELLSRLIRLNTVNPPGNERPAQELLAEHLGAAGFQCELLGAEADRPNLLARLSAAADGPTLCYLAHVDTVLADPCEWTHDPWSGEIADGFLWGRGALDMKSQLAAEVTAAAALARCGWRPARGELLIAAVVDEETGGALGARWLTRTHPEKVRCDLLVNEGGGQVFEYRGQRYYGACCAEKGVFRFTVTTDGVAGHASMPGIGENALLKMAPVLERLASRQPSYVPTPESLAFLRGLGEDDHDLPGALARLAADDSRLLRMFEPMFAVTFTPTRITASEKINVIPSSATLSVDCRVPPGLGEPEVRKAIAEVLGDEHEHSFQIDFDEQVTGNRSPWESTLMDTISDWIAERDPDALVVPAVFPGFTDSNHFRAAFPECVAYGFFPQRHQSLFNSSSLVHGADERIDVRDLTFASEFFRDLALRVLG